MKSPLEEKNRVLSSDETVRQFSVEELGKEITCLKSLVSQACSQVLDGFEEQNSHVFKEGLELFEARSDILHDRVVSLMELQTNGTEQHMRVWTSSKLAVLRDRARGLAHTDIDLGGWNGRVLIGVVDHIRALLQKMERQ